MRSIPMTRPWGRVRSIAILVLKVNIMCGRNRLNHKLVYLLPFFDGAYVPETNYLVHIPTVMIILEDNEEHRTPSL